MVPIKQMLLTNHNRPKIKIIKLKGIVMHWTANYGKGADAVANRNYFNTTTRNASAHYIVDDHQIVQCIPDDEVAWHVGADSYRAAGKKLSDGKHGPNFFLIGIEMCVNSDGDWNKTYWNAAELAAARLKEHNLTINDLYRHYDITGKDCPKMMIDEGAWAKFKNAVSSILNSSSNISPQPGNNTQPVNNKEQYKTGVVTADVLNCRAQPSVKGQINGRLIKGARVKIYGEKDGWYLVNKINPQWISAKYVNMI